MGEEGEKFNTMEDSSESTIDENQLNLENQEVTASEFDDRANIESLLQILDDDEPIKDLVEYKIMIKTSINNILIKLENDAEYRQSLEDDLENLEIEYNKKCFEVDRISNEAQEAINDCKNEADEMSEAMMHKLSYEISQRISAENLVKRLQKEVLSYKKFLKGQKWEGSGEINKYQQLLAKKDEEYIKLQEQRELEFEMLFTLADKFERSIALIKKDQNLKDMKEHAIPETDMNLKLIELNKENLSLKAEVEQLKLTISATSS